MTERELNQLRWVNREIQYYEQQLCFLQSAHCTRPVSSQALLQVQALLEIARQRQWIEKNALEMEIETITDVGLRRIMRLRFINGYTWAKIADETNAADEAIPRKKVHTYIKSREEVEKWKQQKS